MLFDPATNVQLNSDGIDVTWVSENEEEGSVEWAYGANGREELDGKTGTYAVALDWRSANPDRPKPYAEYANKRTHRVRLIGADAGSIVYYRVLSGAAAVGPFDAKLPTAALVSPEDFMTGQVTYPDGAWGADCLVSLRITANVYSPDDGSLVATRDSAWGNTMTDDVAGKYVIGITNLRDAGDLDSRLAYSNAARQATVTVIARCDAGSTAILSSFSSDLALAGGQFLGVDLLLSAPQP